MCVISTKKQQELYWIKWLILTGHTFLSAKIARNMKKKKKKEKIAEKVVECSLAVKTKVWKSVTFMTNYIYFNSLPLELFPLTVKNLLFPVNFDREKPFFLRVSILNFAREMLKKEPAQIDLFACAMRLTAALTYYLLKHTASHAETNYEGC